MAQEKVDSLHLRVYQASIYLFSEYLRRKIRDVFHNKTVKKPEDSAATTELMNILLELQFPEAWTHVETLQAHRDKFHQFREQGSRWWSAASFLGPGCLIVSSEEMSQAM